MKPAGITIRRLTLLRDRLQLDRNALTSSIDHSERDRDIPVYDAIEIKEMKATRSRIDTALEQIKPALVSLTTIYASGWLDMPTSAVSSAVRRGRPQ